MRKVFKLIFIFIWISIFLLLPTSFAKATTKCTITTTIDSGNNVTAVINGLDPDLNYNIVMEPGSFGLCDVAPKSDGSLTIQISGKYFTNDAQYKLEISDKKPWGTCAILLPIERKYYCNTQINVNNGIIDIIAVNILKPTECNYSGTSSGIETALGCFPTEPKAIVEWFLKYGLIIGGGIAFLLMLFGGFQLITSTGDPEKLKKGQEILFSALAGLLLIIFAVFILRIIGVTIFPFLGWN